MVCPFPSASPIPVQFVCPARASNLRSQVAIPLGTGQPLAHAQWTACVGHCLDRCVALFCWKDFERREKAADCCSREKVVPSAYPQP